MLRKIVCFLCLLVISGQALAQEAAKPLAGAINRRFTLVSEDGEYSLRLTGRVHYKGQFPVSGPADESNDTYMQLRRIRTGVEGKLARHYEFKIEYDFGRGSAVLTDGYLGLTHFKTASLRMGRYKAPFSGEELTSSNSIRFVERSMINRFAPSRQIGTSLHGKSVNFGYMAGIFEGAVTGEWLFAGRASVSANKFTIGANALSENNEGSSSLIDFRSGQGTRWYRYHGDVVSNGSRMQVGADVGYWGTPLHFVGEVVMASQDVALEDESKSLSHTGFTVQAGYVLTGENATHSGVTPKRDFDPANGGMGAFELVARYSQITPDEEAMDFARSGSVKGASELTMGLNWYMSRHTKLMLNFVQTSFDGEIGGDASESGILMRMQLNY